MNFDEITKIPCNKIKELTDKKIDNIVETVINHYYKVGFPFFELDDEKLYKDYCNVKNSSIRKIEISNELQQNMAGLYFVNLFHPEMFSVQCKNLKTPMEVFKDRGLFKKALMKRVKYSDSPLYPFNIRKALKTFSGTQSVSNFRPTIAKYIYDKYCPEGGSVLDPCIGYGGRIMGAFCSHVGTYYGYDPNEVTIGNNLNLVKKLMSVGDSKCSFSLNSNPFEVNQDISDRHSFKWKQFDLVFTSPPYFNLEKYSNDSEQSWVKYPTFDLWCEGFLKRLIIKSHTNLKDDGIFAINPAGEEIVEYFFKESKKLFKLMDTKYMRLSKMMGTKKIGESHKLEPIFIMRKK